MRNPCIRDAIRYDVTFGKIIRVPSSEVALEDVDNESYTEYLSKLYHKLSEVQANAHEPANSKNPIEKILQ